MTWLRLVVPVFVSVPPTGTQDAAYVNVPTATPPVLAGGVIVNVPCVLPAAPDTLGAPGATAVIVKVC